MNKVNPYSLVFGKEPIQMINRIGESDEVLNNFLAEVSPQQIYMITGVRGSGKTVQMAEISKKIKENKNWVVVELNPATDLLVDLASKLYNDKRIVDIFKKAKINLSFWGIGIEIKGADKITNIEVAITDMLESLKKENKRILITIDEVTNSETMRIFASAYQIFVRQNLPIYLLMTGLYENIDALQNEKNLTFLYRAPKLHMKPLNIGSISRHYKNTFDITDEDAREMAKMTKGYSFAFQVLGYYTYEHNGDFKAALDEFIEYVEEYSYAKIWSELSGKDKSILYALANSSTGKISEVRGETGLKSNEISPYRDRLIKRGLLDGGDYGYLRFTLPYFEEYVLNNYIL